MAEQVEQAGQAGQAEQTFAQTSFGTVTSKRVIYQTDKGWFSGGSRTDIPLQHVTSVRLEISRSVGWGIICVLLGLSFLVAESGGAKIFGLGLLGLAVLLLWGSPSVVVNTAGQDLKAASGFPWHRDEAALFVEALRKQLFKS